MLLFFRRIVAIVVVFLALGVLCGGFLLPGAVKAASATSPAIKLSPTFGPPTTPVEITGTGFGAQETIILDFAKTQVGSAQTDSSGAFSATITVPMSATPGYTVIKAIGQVSTLTAKALFLVRTDWPMSGFDAQHTRDNPYEDVLNTSNVSQLVQAWVEPTASETSTPVIADNTVYVGTAGQSSDEFYAFNATTGTIRWMYPLSTGHAATILNHVVYVSADKIYAFDARTGKLLWTATTGSYCSAPVLAMHIIYVGCFNDSVYAFHAATGSLIWSATTGGSITGSPAVGKKTVYIGSDDGNIYAFDATTGTLLWKHLTGGAITTSPAVSNGLVYITSSDGNVYALKGRSGATLWTASLDYAPTYSSPAIANGNVYVAGENLEEFQAQTGALMWDVKLNSEAISSPTIANGVIYLSEAYENATLFALNAMSGATLWANSLFVDGSNSSITVVNGNVYVGTGIPVQNGGDYLYAFHLPT
jgi:outer membrane protein assembly factor BamB